MVKTINIPMDDGDYEKLLEMKGDGRSWREFILSLIKNDNETPDKL